MPAAPNLVQNNSFEDSFTSWTFDASSSIHANDGADPSHTGDYEAYINRFSPGWGEFYQDIATIAGHTYSIDFWLASNGSYINLTVYFGSTSKFYYSPNFSMTYIPENFTAVATDPVTRFLVYGDSLTGTFFFDDVTITDSNGNYNPPVFDSGNAATTLENVSTSSTVYDANAHDDDGDTITYSLSSGGDNDLFLINSSTGEIRFANSPDYENPTDTGANNIYDIVVHANDGLHDVTQAVAITVGDENDNAPVFTTSAPNLVQNGGFESGYADWTFSGAANIHGADGPDPSHSGNIEAYINAYPGYGEITQVIPTIPGHAYLIEFYLASNGSIATVYSSFGSTLGYHAYDPHRGFDYIPITHSAVATDSLTTLTIGASEITATFFFDDVSVVPLFEFCTVSENTPVTNVVYDANATDADGTPANNTIVYSLSAGGDNDLFSIDPTTGEVRFLVSPDYENPADSNHDNIYDVVVHANDGLHDVTQAAAVMVTDAVEHVAGSPSADTLVGGSGADSIDGLAGNDSLAGGGGDDTLAGGDGRDTLDGGAGADSMLGGAGNDVYFADSPLDAVSELAAGGTDTVNVTTAGSYTLAANVEKMTVTGLGDFALTGNGGVNTITGGDGNDTLHGAGGADRLVGGVGDDTYLIDDLGVVISEGSGMNNDSVLTTLPSLTLASNVENLTYSQADWVTAGSGNFTGTGNGSANLINGGTGNDALSGLGGNDSLNGGAGSDTIAGGAGNDTLDGGAGNDSMAGGIGNDTYVVDSSGDVVIENTAEGTDTIQTALGSFDLGPIANVESLTFTGSSNFIGSGNALANTIKGAAGNDSLSGANGNDQLRGDAGSDTLNGGNGNDKLYGEDGNDSLLGGAGNDQLDGGADNDTMTGGTGADKFFFTETDGVTGGAVLGEITDFSHAQSDKVDVSAIDAVSNISGSGPFTFIGNGGFTGTAGQLHYVINGSGGVNVEGDTNGAGFADFSITVDGVSALLVGDFAL